MLLVKFDHDNKHHLVLDFVTLNLTSSCIRRVGGRGFVFQCI